MTGEKIWLNFRMRRVSFTYKDQFYKGLDGFGTSRLYGLDQKHSKTVQNSSNQTVQIKQFKSNSSNQTVQIKHVDWDLIGISWDIYIYMYIYDYYVYIYIYIDIYICTYIYIYIHWYI